MSVFWRRSGQLLSLADRLSAARFGRPRNRTAPKNPADRTPPEIIEKVLHLRTTYRLGPIRIVWYLARYHAITISDAGVYRILRRNGLSRLPGGTRVRKIHTQRYQQQVPGHQSRLTSSS